MDHPTLTPRLVRLDRPSASGDLAAGAVQLRLPVIPAGYMAELEQVTVSGANLGGARVSLYVSEVIPEMLVGTVTLGATDPGTSFGDTRPWLFGDERLVVDISGAGAGRASVRVWQRLHAVEYSRPSAAAAPVLNTKDAEVEE